MHDIILGRSNSDSKKLGTRGTVFIGKQYVQMGQSSSLSNSIYMDVSRAHAMLIVGKRGCFTKGVKIYTNNGFKKIEDFKEKKDKILSLNKETLKYEWESAKLLKYDISKKENLFKITLQDGQILEITAEHPLLVYRSKKVQWIIASELKDSDQVVSVYDLPENKLKNKESLRIARLLGFILADGTLYEKRGEFIDGRGYKYNGRKCRIRIINAEDKILKQAKDDFDKEFNVKSRIYKKGKENCYIVETEQQKIFDKLVKLGVHVGKKDKLINIPEIVWKSSLKFKAEFLKALYSCDGYVSKDQKVFYYSNSLQIMKDLQLLLLEFAVQSRIKEKKVKLNGRSFLSYQLYFGDYSSLINFQKIGFYNEEKQKRLMNKKFNLVRNRKGTKYLNDHLFCQKIISIERFNGVSQVYDLRVPKNHSFVANGIISHNSGKSYTMGSVVEGLADMDPEVSKNLSFLMLDTMGVYWSMKYGNKKEDDLLKKWGLEGKGLDVIVCVPGGFFQKYQEDGIACDYPLYIKPKELSLEDWRLTFKLKVDDPVYLTLAKTVGKMIEQDLDFEIGDIIEKLNQDQVLSKETILAIITRLEEAQTWGIFSKNARPIRDLLFRGKVTVLDFSAYVSLPGGWEVKALALGLIAKKIFVERMLVRKREELAQITSKTQITGKDEIEDDLPMPWLIIDEAHEFLPESGETPATNALMTILREGRQPGVSLILATQQPAKIHTDAITQSDIVLAHRLTASFDLQSLDKIFLSYNSKGSKALFNQMPKTKGCAIIMDDKNERLYTMQVKPRISWHGGEDPSAIEEIEDEFDF